MDSIDITSAFSGFGDAIVNFTSAGDYFIFHLNLYRVGTMSLELEYLQDIEIPVEKETFTLVGGLIGELNLYSGEFVTTFHDAIVKSGVLSYPVSHAHKKTNEDYCCGNDWRLNLHQKLEGYSLSDVSRPDGGDDPEWMYTDEKGIKHGFNEVFYSSYRFMRYLIPKNSAYVSSFFGYYEKI